MKQRNKEMEVNRGPRHCRPLLALGGVGVGRQECKLWRRGVGGGKSHGRTGNPLL